MASIQQSMNQLLGAMAGAATAGTYLYRQSGHYQDVLAERKAQKLEKTAGEVQQEIHNQTQIVDDFESEEGRRNAQARTKAIVGLTNYRDELRQEAYKTSPTSKRAKHLVGIERGNVIRQERKNMAEQFALERQEDEINRQREQKEALAVRTSILRGTPAEHLLYQKEDNK